MAVYRYDGANWVVVQSTIGSRFRRINVVNKLIAMIPNNPVVDPVMTSETGATENPSETAMMADNPSVSVEIIT